MADKSFIDSSLARYVEQNSLREAPVLARLREETSAHPESEMQITPLQGQLLQILVKALGARRTLEIGVFTGYSSLAVALALPDDARIYAFDISEEYTATARRYWREGGVEHKIRLQLGPAASSLDCLIDGGQADQYDFAFIDADKPSYPLYYERCLKLVRQGGLLAIDNTLQRGRVAQPAHQEPNTIGMRDFNRQLHADERVLPVLLPIADGLTIVVKL